MANRAVGCFVGVIALACSSASPEGGGGDGGRDGSTSPAPDAFTEGCRPTPYGCVPTPYALVTVGGEPVWVGLAEGEEPPPWPPARPSPIVLANTQEVRPIDLDSLTDLRLPSHDERIDRVYMTIDSASWGAQEPIFAMLREICRINGRRAEGEEIRLVLSVDAGLRAGGFEAELARQGCGFDELGAPQWVTVREGAREIWTQDVMELVEVGFDREDGTQALTTAVWDTPQRRSLSADVLAMEERYPFIGPLNASEGERGARGGAGGNVESLPDGRFLVGTTALEPFQAWVLSRGGLVLPSGFFTVGHIDEWLTVRPDGVVVYTHPLQALDTIVRATDAAWEEMQRTLLRMAEEADVLAVGPGFTNYAMLHLRREDILGAITYFLRDPTKRPPYRVDDFDLTRPDRAPPRSRIRVGIKRSDARPIGDMDEFRTRFADLVVRRNVTVFEEHILPGLVMLSNAGVRTQATPELLFGGGSALPSMINAVWLDDVVVTADPGFAPFRRAFEAAVGRRVVWTNGTMTWLLDGGVHCMTQVSRRPPCEPVTQREELIFDHEALECACLDGGDPERGCDASGCDRATTCGECNGVGFEGCGWCPGTGCIPVAPGAEAERDHGLDPACAMHRLRVRDEPDAVPAHRLGMRLVRGDRELRQQRLVRDDPRSMRRAAERADVRVAMREPRRRGGLAWSRDV